MRNNLIKLSAIAAVLFALSACSGSNDSDTPVVDSNGKHPANWKTTHKSVTDPSAVCAGCHGNDLSGGISKVSCMNPAARCHTSSPALNPTGCVSCHAAGTTGPNGTTSPNRANAHAKHLALTGVSCATCHSGAGYGTPLHADGTANVTTIPDAFKAKTGSFSYNAGTCAAVSCHGGQTTPDWSTGSINVATDCLKCHRHGSAPVPPETIASPEYNSFYSGFSANFAVDLHQLHLNLDTPANPITCTSCHDTAKLAVNHFTNLATRTFESTAASTIGDTNGNTKVTQYTTPSGTCTTFCHITRNWQN